MLLLLLLICLLPTISSQVPKGLPGYVGDTFFPLVGSTGGTLGLAVLVRQPLDSSSSLIEDGPSSLPLALTLGQAVPLSIHILASIAAVICDNISLHADHVYAATYRCASSTWQSPSPLHALWR